MTSGTGQIFLDEEPADLGDFEKLIGDRGIDTPVILAVDTSAPFGAFFEIVDRLKALGFDDLSIETRPESP